MMASMEDYQFSSSLMGEDLSIWSIDLIKSELEDGASLGTTIPLKDAAASIEQDQKSFIVDGVQSNPLPEWMSEKIDISDWADVLADSSATQFKELQMDKIPPADEFLASFMAEENTIPDFFMPPDYLDVDGVLPESPGSSLGSGGSAFNSNVPSPSPSSPCSLDSDIGPGSDPFRETEDVMETDISSFDLLINSCKDGNALLQLADSIPMHLPIPREEDIKSLLVDVGKMQSDLQGKVKSESKFCKRKTKTKAITKARKERKKGQNKEAATRYRQKKKKESSGLNEQVEDLQKKNGKLKDKVGSLEQEITYLKNLLQEIFVVKGQIKVLESP